MSGHDQCGGNAYQQVQCDRCKRTYQCTPFDDYYCVTDSEEHVCESCLVGGAPIASIDLEAPLADPIFHKPADGER